MRNSIGFLVLLALSRAASGQVSTGSYAGQTLDARPLPAVLTAATTAGFYRWIKLDQAMLRLRPDGHFTVSYKYYEQQLQLGKRPTGAKLMSETQQGSYTVRGAAISFFPAKPKTGPRPPNSVGQLTSKGILLPYNLRDGKVVKRHSLLVVRDASYW